MVDQAKEPIAVWGLPSDDDAALPAPDLASLIHQIPGDATEEPRPALAPYLMPVPGFSDQAYREWIERVCKQPSDSGD